MKAPDKIYMPNELLSEEWSRHIEGEDTEYICKDTILEWLRKQQALASHPNAATYDEYLYQKVIDKINSI